MTRFLLICIFRYLGNTRTYYKYVINMGIYQKKGIVLCGSTKKIGNYSSIKFKKEYQQTPLGFNVSKTGMTNLNSMAALVTVNEWADQD